jgi:hypothetical protein
MFDGFFFYCFVEPFTLQQTERIKTTDINRGDDHLISTLSGLELGLPVGTGDGDVLHMINREKRYCILAAENIPDEA